MKTGTKIIGSIGIVLSGLLMIFVITDRVLSIFDWYQTKVLSIIAITLFLLLLAYSVVIMIMLAMQNKIANEQSKKSYDEQIAFWDSLLDKNNKLYLINQDWNVYLHLAVLSLFKGDNDIASKYLNMNPKTKNSMYSYYPFYIIAVYQNDIEKAKVYYNKIMKLKGTKFLSQINTTKNINNMIIEEVFSEEVYNTTNYPIVKEICNRYKI